MIKDMDMCERDAVLAVADKMVTAAKTAPKASGQDSIVAAVVTGEDKDRLAEAMREIGKREDKEFCIRDAGNVDNSICVVLIACKERPYGLKGCGLCGFENCAEMKKANAVCAFNLSDLGIAVGSAVSLAADNRVDNRVMYSAGRGAMELEMLPGNVRICYGIPLNATSKSIFFDRNPGAVLF